MTNPSLALSQEDRKMADKETKMLVPTGVWGASGHGLLCGSPLNAARASCPSGHCLEESGAWPAFSSLVHFRGAQEASHRCPDKEKMVEEEALAMAPPPGNPPLPSPLPGYGPEEPCMLRPLKPLVSVPRRLGRV